MQTDSNDHREGECGGIKFTVHIAAELAYIAAIILVSFRCHYIW